MNQLEPTSRQIQEQIDQLLLESKNNPDLEKQRSIDALMIYKEKQMKFEEELKMKIKVPEDIKNARKKLIIFLREHQNFLNNQDVRNCYLLAYGTNILSSDHREKERYEGESMDSSIFGVPYWEYVNTPDEKVT